MPRARENMHANSPHLFFIFCINHPTITMSDEQEAAATTEPPKETTEAPAGDDAAPKEEESTATFEPVVSTIRMQCFPDISRRADTSLLL